MREWMRVILVIGFAITGSDYSFAQFAVSVEFGEPTNLSTCSRSGRNGDRSCSTSYLSREQASDKRSANAYFSAQASADKSVYPIISNPNARAALHFRYSVPFQVTRAIEFSEDSGGNYLVVVPQPTVRISFTVHGMGLVTDDDPGEDGSASVSGVRVTSQRLGLIDENNPTLDWGPLDSCGPAYNPYCYLEYVYFGAPPDTPSGGVARLLEHGSSVGEIDSSDQFPADDFLVWDDLVEPFADYAAPPQGFIQTFRDTLEIEVTLVAESTGNGPEYIACLGKQSPLSGFGITDDWCDGSVINGFVEGQIVLHAEIANIEPPYSFVVSGSSPGPEPDEHATPIPVLNKWSLLLLTLLALATGSLFLTRRQSAP